MVTLGKGDRNSSPLVLESDATIHMWRDVPFGMVYLGLCPAARTTATDLEVL
jgi:hypothetical protein